MSKCNQQCNQGRNCVCGDADNWVNLYILDAICTILLCISVGIIGFALGLAS